MCSIWLCVVVRVCVSPVHHHQLLVTWHTQVTHNYQPNRHSEVQTSSQSSPQNKSFLPHHPPPTFPKTANLLASLKSRPPYIYIYIYTLYIVILYIELYIYLFTLLFGPQQNLHEKSPPFLLYCPVLLTHGENLLYSSQEQRKRSLPQQFLLWTSPPLSAIFLPCMN